MREEEIRNKLIRVITGLKNVSETDLERGFEEIGFSSLDVVDIIMAVEDDFELEIPIEEIVDENFTCVTSMTELLKRLC